ncbi:MAG: FAD-dependent oxidoreductase [Planctomycetota bacterium]|jgi:NADPH-dependent 2,4-dienoyl-CoA reductase/sulfur reductase-like enzyme/Fe-S-cluster-containing hydrogenase component 2/bacterioferritin-associated ferredoxin
MAENLRIRLHPILPAAPPAEVHFSFNGKSLLGIEGEPLSSALFAAGIRTFGTHPHDGSPQGIYCANGQCNQCLVLADGVPVKGCMAPVRKGLDVRSLDALPGLPSGDLTWTPAPSPPEKTCDVLVVGGGPSGIMGAVEIARHGLQVLLVDDKHHLGGKLVLQTHSFFGSVAECYAGVRGIDIATILSRELEAETHAEVWLNATVVGCFCDGKFGVLRPEGYTLVRPRGVLVATGAREKSIAFPGWDLPGVYGAGAFQTLVNRDLVKAAERVFILGGGNVGLIAAYHALQAGMHVVGLAEALPEVGGYKVHQDKILRLGVPVLTSHTVVRAEGEGHLERVVTARVDPSFQPVPGTERTVAADTLLVAVGLTPVDELHQDARAFGLTVRATGDAQEIAEASAAMFSGRIEGRRLVKDLGETVEIPKAWGRELAILKSRPGATRVMVFDPGDHKVYPVIRCTQEIPCNPCVETCKEESIRIPGDDIRGLPVWEGECSGCGRCVAICPGLAITLVDERKSEGESTALVTVPFELNPEGVSKGGGVVTVDEDGKVLGEGVVRRIRNAKSQDRCRLVTVEVPWADRRRVAGIRVQEAAREGLPSSRVPRMEDPVICRCERVRRGEIEEEIRAGCRDMNQLKSQLRCGMGACGGKTCTPLIQGLFRNLGVAEGEVIPPTRRPFVTEVPLGVFAGGKGGDVGRPRTDLGKEGGAEGKGSDFRGRTTR